MRRRPGPLARRPLACLLIALLPVISGCAIPAVADPAAAGGVELLDDRILRRDDGPRGIPLGGLSEIAADGQGGYLLISDDRGAYGPPRYLRLQIDFNLQTGRFQIGARDWEMLITGHAPGVQPPDMVDAEALRVVPGTGNLVWSSEGEIWDGVPADIYLSDATGRLLRTFELPIWFRPDRVRGTSHRGMRPNKAFEALDATADGQQVVAMVEDVLMQELDVRDQAGRVPVRVLRFDIATGRLLASHVYPVDPFPDPGTAGDRMTNAAGAVSMLLLSDGRYLVLERGFERSLGVRIRLYLVDPRRADDVSDIENLSDRPYRPAEKILLADLIGAGLRADNWEGMAFGPDLPDGRMTLVLVSDDNFNQLFQSTIIAWMALPPLDTIGVQQPGQ